MVTYMLPSSSDKLELQANLTVLWTSRKDGKFAAWRKAEILPAVAQFATNTPHEFSLPSHVVGNAQLVDCPVQLVLHVDGSRLGVCSCYSR